MTQQKQMIKKSLKRDECPHSHTYEKMGMYSGQMLIHCSDCGKILGPVKKILNSHKKSLL